MTETRFDVVGIGNAIVDVLSFSEDALLDKFNLRKGTMILIDEERAEQLYREMGPATECSGGAVANTMAGLVSLGGTAAFMGTVRDDQLGTIFTHDLRAVGVHYDTSPATEGKSTARCLIFVTPDAQRTMNTYIGACALLSPSKIDEGVIAASAMTFIEGYMWYEEETKLALRKSMELARKYNREIVFSLCDVFCVENRREDFLNLTKASDIVFANEAEIKSLYETATFEEAVSAVRGQCRIAVLTRSEKGSVVVTADETITVPATKVEDVVDTTGAGDLYSAGFLYGYARGWPLAECAELGGKCAAQVIQHMGARVMKPLSQLVEAA